MESVSEIYLLVTWNSNKCNNLNPIWQKHYSHLFVHLEKQNSNKITRFASKDRII